MKFSKYVRGISIDSRDALSAVPLSPGLIGHPMQEAFFLHRITGKSLQKIRQPPIFPGRLQPSIVGRVSLNHRVRDGYGCFPDAHRHRKYSIVCLFAVSE